MGPFETDTLASRFAPTSDKSAWVESFAVLGLTVGIGYLVQPSDPLFTDSGFPWAVLSPALIGLRYGFAQAFVVAACLQVLALGYALLSNAAPWPIPVSYNLGTLLIAMICGEFRDIWANRIEHLERSNNYRQARLEEFTRTYHLLKISHDRLEQANAGNRSSLRSAMLELRRIAQARGSVEETAGALLDMVNNYCTVQSATVWKLEGNRLRESIGQVGAQTTDADKLTKDPLFVAALTNQMTASVDVHNAESTSGRKPGDPLVCVPLLDAYRETQAMLVVTQLPFFSFSERNLQLLTIICGAIADFLRPQEEIAASLPNDTAEFVMHTRRCYRDAKTFDLSAAVLAIEFKNETLAPALVETIRDETRGLDLVLEIDGGEHPALLLLLPLTRAAGLSKFLVRFNSYIRERHNDNAAALGIELEQFLLDRDATPEDFDDFLSSHLTREQLEHFQLRRQDAA